MDLGGTNGETKFHEISHGNSRKYLFVRIFALAIGGSAPSHPRVPGNYPRVALMVTRKLANVQQW